MRKWMKLAALVAVVALASTACTGGGSTNNDTKTGGHLILGSLSNIDTLNPFRTFQQNSYATFEYIYPQLVQSISKTLDFLPDFATKWQQSSDGLTWTFTTTPNAKWSDGEALNAQDVAFTFNTIIKYGDGPAGNLVGRARRRDRRQGDRRQHRRAHLLRAGSERAVEPPADLDPARAGVGPVRHGRRRGPAPFPNTPANGQPLVSGGPFELAQYTKDQSAIFQKNPDFYGPAPSVDGFGLQFFSNDDSMVQPLATDEIQAAIGIPVTAMEALKGESISHRVHGPGVSMRDFIINSSPEKTTNLELRTRRPRCDGVRHRP